MAANYMNLIETYRVTFDYMMGAYEWPAYPDKDEGFDIAHTAWLIFYLYVAHIFLLNYLVAILATTYSEMMETGLFSYN